MKEVAVNVLDTEPVQRTLRSCLSEFSSPHVAAHSLSCPSHPPLLTRTTSGSVFRARSQRPMRCTYRPHCHIKQHHLADTSTTYTSAAVMHTSGCQEEAPGSSEFLNQRQASLAAVGGTEEFEAAKARRILL